MQTFMEIKAFVDAVYDPPYLERGMQPPRKIIVPYEYPVEFSVAAGATSTQTLSITANADFVHIRTAAVADVAAAAQTVGNSTFPLARILITDSGTNEQFMSAAVPLGNYATQLGSQESGGSHTFPRIISGRTSLTVQVTSYEAANTNNIRISLQGVLVRIL